MPEKIYERIVIVTSKEEADRLDMIYGTDELVRCKDCSFAEEIDFGLWVCHNADIQIVGDYVDEDWFCANGTTDLGEWDWNEDPRCADFVCSECLQRNITCEERCPHCGIKMSREETDDAEIHRR